MSLLLFASSFKLSEGRTSCSAVRFFSTRQIKQTVWAAKMLLISRDAVQKLSTNAHVWWVAKLRAQLQYLLDSHIIWRLPLLCLFPLSPLLVSNDVRVFTNSPTCCSMRVPSHRTSSKPLFLLSFSLIYFYSGSRRSFTKPSKRSGAHTYSLQHTEGQFLWNILSKIIIKNTNERNIFDDPSSTIYQKL